MSPVLDRKYNGTYLIGQNILDTALRRMYLLLPAAPALSISSLKVLNGRFHRAVWSGVTYYRNHAEIEAHSLHKRCGE